jgi:hypothetical protein
VLGGSVEAGSRFEPKSFISLAGIGGSLICINGASPGENTIVRKPRAPDVTVFAAR